MNPAGTELLLQAQWAEPPRSPASLGRDDAWFLEDAAGTVWRFRENLARRRDDTRQGVAVKHHRNRGATVWSDGPVPGGGYCLYDDGYRFAFSVRVLFVDIHPSGGFFVSLRILGQL
jgi:hypothetical protein